ncbi:MAG: YfiR family protein [Rhodocyclales bacterium GT-UBC]|nr:MAG: YfiR family protein [Rhodocyclales bacterium GT-UBC]
MGLRSICSRRLRQSIAWLALLPALLMTPALAQDVSEYGMKAVLFYRLSQFVYWPPEEKPPSPLVLCIVGKNPFGTNINQLNQGSGTTEIRISPNDIGNCHLLFISRSESANLDNWLNRAEGRYIVTVSDIAGFARAGGMIELPLDGERVGIVINRRSAQKKGFGFNAQLLRLARVIEP